MVHHPLHTDAESVQIISWKTGEKIQTGDEDDDIEEAEKCPEIDRTGEYVEPELVEEKEADNEDEAHPPPYDYILYPNHGNIPAGTLPNERHRCIDHSYSETTWSDHGETQDERVKNRSPSSTD